MLCTLLVVRCWNAMVLRHVNGDATVLLSFALERLIFINALVLGRGYSTFLARFRIREQVKQSFVKQ